MTRLNTAALVREIQSSNEDFEWYPTTDEILSSIKKDMVSLNEDGTLGRYPTVLDCGAGDGRSLDYLTEGKKYAIEKSRPLVHAMDKSIFVIGADFHEQTLIDKNGVDVVFSNPPYSDYETWTCKIIKETTAKFAYLVIPSRWEGNINVEHALTLRNATTQIIGNFDFLNADRKARSVVHVVRVSFSKSRYSSGADIDPFSIWFEESFAIDTKQKESRRYAAPSSVNKDSINNELVKGRDLVSVLTKLYDKDMQKLYANYKALEAIDSSILNELDVSYEGLMEALRVKISGLKNVYWRELFDNFSKITGKLTKLSREQLLNTLLSRTDVDFNSSNAHTIAIWVIKQSNYYFDEQLMQLVEKANIIHYKSNAKTFGDEHWRYCRKPEGLDNFSLDYRIVLEHAGGLILESDYCTRYNGLSPCAYYFVQDILTVACNLGFDTAEHETPSSFTWLSNKKQVFHYHNFSTGRRDVLMEVKAFKNGNLHIKFNQAFIRRLNVEFGRIKGWLKNAHHAADELNISVEETQAAFNSNLSLEGPDCLQLGFSAAA